MARTDFEVRKHAGRPMIAATDFVYAGQAFTKGDPFPTDNIDPRRVQTMHSARRINFETDPRQEVRDALAGRRADLLANPDDSPVQLTAQPGGYYLVSAPWLADPIRIRGKAKAEAEAKRVRDEGPPVLKPVEGLAASVLVLIEGQGFAVTAPWLDAPEPFDNAEAAEARQAELREAGPPEGWTETPQADPIKVGDVVLVGEDAGDLAGLRATVEAIDGDNAEVVGFAEEGAPEGSDLKRGTVPLASLSVEPPSQSNEGEQDDEQA